MKDLERNLREVEERKDKFLSNINTVKAVFESTAQKSAEEITKEEADKYYEICRSPMHNRLMSFASSFSYAKKCIEKKFNEIEENLEKYPHLNRDDIIKPEKESYLKSMLTLIDHLLEKYDEMEQIHNKAHSVMSEYQAISLEKRKEEIKNFTLEPAEPKYAWEEIKDNMSGELKHESGMTSEKIRTLIFKYNAYDRETEIDNDYTEYRSRDISITPFEQCTLEQKNEIREKELKIKEIKNSEDGQYDKPGQIEIPVYSYKGIETIVIDATPRQLAEAGIMYSDMGWMSLEQIEDKKKQAEINSKAIAETDQKEEITNTDLAPLERSGFMKWIENAKKTLKKIITGKGEK